MTEDKRYAYPLSPSELVGRYRALYSGVVYDALEAMKLPDQALATDIKPLHPDMVVAGFAFTIKGIPNPTPQTDRHERRVQIFRDMGVLGVPLVDVRDCSGDTRTAHYGEMNATAGKAAGAVGAVVDGGCRDSGFILRSGFPTFCRYQNPVEAFGRWGYLDWQIRVGLRGSLTSLVAVEPGDLIFGDLDGVLVVPHDAVIEVLERAERLVKTETSSRSDYASGEDPVKVFSRYGRM